LRRKRWQTARPMVSSWYLLEMELMCDNLGEVFRANVRKRMDKLNVTQADLAEKMGVTRPFVSHMLTGYRNPGLETLKNFAEALDTTAAKLLDEQIIASST